MCLRVGHQHSQFWPILVRFVQYYSVFWGPRAISTIDDPGVRLLVHRQQSQFWLILTRFMDYNSVLGSRSHFHGCRTSWCVYMSVINTHNFGQFWPVSWTITQFWAHVVISTTDEHRGAFMCRSSNTRSFGRFWPVSWTITDCFGVPKPFPWLSNLVVRLHVSHQHS